LAISRPWNKTQAQSMGMHRALFAHLHRIAFFLGADGESLIIFPMLSPPGLGERLPFCVAPCAILRRQFLLAATADKATMPP
jgi:hypothetical protein